MKKNRWGGKGGEFLVCVLSGYGIHKGLTALFDCVELGLVQRKRTLKIGDESIGYLKTYFEYAREGNENEFQVFYDLLKGQDEQSDNGD